MAYTNEAGFTADYTFRQGHRDCAVESATEYGDHYWALFGPASYIWPVVMSAWTRDETPTELFINQYQGAGPTRTALVVSAAKMLTGFPLGGWRTVNDSYGNPGGVRFHSDSLGRRGQLAKADRRWTGTIYSGLPYGVESDSSQNGFVSYYDWNTVTGRFFPIHLSNSYYDGISDIPGMLFRKAIAFEWRRDA